MLFHSSTNQTDGGRETEGESEREVQVMMGEIDLREMGYKLIDSEERIFKPTGIKHVTLCTHTHIFREHSRP